MLQPDFDPAPTTLRMHQCKYVSKCKCRGCLERAILVAKRLSPILLSHRFQLIAAQRSQFGTRVYAVGHRCIPPEYRISDGALGVRNLIRRPSRNRGIGRHIACGAQRVACRIVNVTVEAVGQFVERAAGNLQFIWKLRIATMNGCGLPYQSESVPHSTRFGPMYLIKLQSR